MGKRSLNSAKPLTKEEEADEIVRKLSTPPSRPISDAEILSDELARIMLESMKQEIDDEIMKAITGWKK